MTSASYFKSTRRGFQASARTSITALVTVQRTMDNRYEQVEWSFLEDDRRNELGYTLLVPRGKALRGEADVRATPNPGEAERRQLAIFFDVKQTVTGAENAARWYARYIKQCELDGIADVNEGFNAGQQWAVVAETCKMVLEIYVRQTERVVDGEVQHCSYATLLTATSSLIGVVSLLNPITA